MNAKPSQPSLDFDVQRVREDFPLLRRTVHGKPLVYLDNANTSQKPRPTKARATSWPVSSTPVCATKWC